MSRINIALVGNPNCGKTTFFNTLTGLKQHVGNWPGKTVEKKEGTVILDDYNLNIIDLPGSYSLSSFSLDESVTRDYIINEQPDLVIQIVDATNLQRNLHLTMEVVELSPNLILVLNMDHLAKKKGIHLNSKKLSELLGVPVFKVDARDKADVKEFITGALAQVGRKPKDMITLHYGEEIEEHINELEDLLKGRDNTRWTAIKLIENDPIVIANTKEIDGVAARLKKIKSHLATVFGESSDVIISQRRNALAAGLFEQIAEKVKSPSSKSDKIDKYIINKHIGIPIFLIVTYILFYLTFTLAEPFVGIIDSFVGWLADVVPSLLVAANAPEWLISLVSQGIIGGVGSVIVFLPNILILFFLISLLEDSGYFARAAYIMDNFMHRIGLHGKSFIPLVLGFGCNVPAIMATRSLERKEDRLLTTLIIPFTSCSARLPVYILFVSVFFAQYKGLIVFSLYFLGIIVAIATGFLLNKFILRSTKTDLIMELPSYRIPTMAGAIIHMWERGKLFIYKAGTLILVASIVVWFVSSFPLGVTFGSEQSFAGMIGNAIAPIFSPLGFGNWESAVSLMFGVVAKETVISTFGTLYGVAEGSLGSVLQTVFTPLSAIAFMVMTLVYIPCIATIGMIKRETGSWKWAGFSLTYSLVIGWLLSFVVYQGGLLLGLT